MLPLILKAKKKEEAKVGVYAKSEIQKGASRAAYICCNKELGTGCEPFPKCCDCNVQNDEMEIYPANENDLTEDNNLNGYRYRVDDGTEEVPIVEILND